MSDRRLLGIGLGGSALAAVCCFTPAAGGGRPVGLSAWLAWLDYGAHSVLAVTGYALVRGGGKHD